MEIKLGSNDQNTNGEVTKWQQWFGRYARSYAPPVDGYVGNNDVAAIRTLQTNLARSGIAIVVDGIFGDRVANAVGYKWGKDATPPTVVQRRPIWFYSAPGSGAPWDVGPSFDLGNRARDILKLNHQPIGYPIGGYLGFMGGDPKFSYLDVIHFLDLEFERLLDINADVQQAMYLRTANPTAKVEVEIWVSAYSQSADGVRRSLYRLFGPGGKYALIADRINGIVNFGDPGTPITGIARTSYPPSFEKLVTEINYANDFYAVATDRFRPAFYKIIIEADMELPFFVHVLKVAIPIILDWAKTAIPIIGPLLGGTPFGSMTQFALGLIPQLSGVASNPVFGQMLGMAGSAADSDVDKQLYDLLVPSGVISISTVMDLIGLVSALPGLQAHGGYRFDAVMMNKAYDVLARFTRDSQGNRR